jgi:hypothetical protein
MGNEPYSDICESTVLVCTKTKDYEHTMSSKGNAIHEMHCLAFFFDIISFGTQSDIVNSSVAASRLQYTIKLDGLSLDYLNYGIQTIYAAYDRIYHRQSKMTEVRYFRVRSGWKDLPFQNHRLVAR